MGNKTVQSRYIDEISFQTNKLHIFELSPHNVVSTLPSALHHSVVPIYIYFPSGWRLTILC
jgi:5-keto 4-deoxyuronate isomerase